MTNLNQFFLHLVPPKILPWAFPEITKEGDSIFATCAIVQGDAPVRLRWLKDTEVIVDTSSTTLEIKPTTKYPSDIITHRMGDGIYLQIRYATQKHSGTFTCEASNVGGTVTHSAKLLVHGKSKYLQHTWFIIKNTILYTLQTTTDKYMTYSSIKNNHLHSTLISSRKINRKRYKLQVVPSSFLTCSSFLCPV